MESNYIKIEDKLITVKINKHAKDNMTCSELYEVSRGLWKLSLKRAKNFDYVISIRYGCVQDVYQVKDWFQVKEGTLDPVKNRKVTSSDMESWAKGRVYFVRKEAPKEIRNKYIGKDTTRLFKKGNSNPCKYFENKKY